MFDRPEVGEKAILVNINFNNINHREDTNELIQLVTSAGFDVAEIIQSKKNQPDARYFVGSGKAQELVTIKEITKSSTIVFNHELTPSQERNIEKLTGLRVYDRTALILYIFSQRAKSYEGKLQVELAHLDHLSSRLTKGWSHLERQKGGIGLRGTGETQLETDRRLINQRIKSIKAKLNKSHKQREINRYSRNKSDQTLIALVGYTNAGKTTLFNLLTESELYAKDKLFATLDSVTRKSSLAGLDDVLFSDTVGFISDLPTELIESFKATLDELKSADILLHVVDISDPDFIFKTDQVELILKELGVSEIPCIRVNNKSDKVSKDLNNISNSNDEVWLSAMKNRGLEDLIKCIQSNRKKSMVKEWVELEPSEGKTRAKLYSLGKVIEETTTESGLIQLLLEIDEKELKTLVSKKGINLKIKKIKEAI